MLAETPYAAGMNGPDAEPHTPVADGLGFALGVASSFRGRAWRMHRLNAEATRALELCGHSPALARILGRNGVTPATAPSFLDPRLRDLLPDPLVFAQMERAATRFAEAVMAKESIAILGDYDVDGACSAALLLNYLKALGQGALLYVPDRLTEGYGPSVAAMTTLAAKGARLLVTVDCGAAADAAMAAASANGLTAIVLDHHAVETHPPVFAHVNPNAPGDSSGHTYVCAAGLVFLFLVAVQRVLRGRDWFGSQSLAEPDLLRELDLVALATVADVVPLKGLNRAFVRQGLRRLDALERPGLAALARLASATAPFSTYHLGFVFGPRINAGGRVGRCDLGSLLLTSDDPTTAHALAIELDLHNRERQALEAQILESAQAMALAQENNSFLLLAGDNWHPGVVGIIAGRLKERHAKPVFVAGFDGTGAIARGSARGVDGIDLGAIVRAARTAGLLESGGGHAMAAGFTIKREHLAAFGQFLSQHLDPKRRAMAAAGELLADAILSPSGADLALLADLERAGPFGAGNPEPLFLMPDMMVAYAGMAGANHVRLRLVGPDGQAIGAIAFRAADTALGQGLLKARGHRIHAAGRLKRDDYDGTAKIQLHLEDAAPADL